MEAHGLSSSSPGRANDTAYPPLRDPRHQTRILRLASAASGHPLSGNLEVISTATPDRPYEALSYEWGPPPNGEFRFCLTNGHSINITENLANALDDLRHQDPSAAPRLLWADGICINQNDTEERQEQVAIMSEIYRKAARVVTYMGPEKDNSSVAITAIERCCGSINNNTSEGQQEEHLTQLEKNAIRDLLSRGWSTRCWCALEFSLNKRLLLVCGRRTLTHWSLMAQFVIRIFNGKMPADVIPKPSHGATSQLECIYQLVLLRDKVQGLRFSEERRLSWLLYEFQVFEATNILDKVYPLIGVATDIQVPIDYTRSARSVYIHVAKKILANADDLTILHHSFPTKAQELPSWVPDWSKWSYGTEFVVRCSQLSPSRGRKPSIRLRGLEDKIELKGRVVGTVTHLGTPVNDYYVRDSDSTRRIPWMQKEKHAIEAHMNSTATFQVAECLLGADSFAGEGQLKFNIKGFHAHVKQPEDIIENHERSLAHGFVTSVRRRSRYSRLGVVSGKHVANVPVSTRDGDWIVMLDGGKHLYVLRETSAEGEFVYIGISFVSGLMHGILLAPGSRWKDRWFTLV